MERIKDLINKKKHIVDSMLETLITTDDHAMRNELAQSLVDHFRDERILPTLVNIIGRPDLKHYNAYLTFCCHQYGDCKQYIEFFCDVMINHEYHPALEAFWILSAMPPLFKKEVVERNLENIKKAIEIPENKEKKEMFEYMIDFYEFQLQYNLEEDE